MCGQGFIELAGVVEGLNSRSRRRKPLVRLAHGLEEDILAWWADFVKRVDVRNEGAFDDGYLVIPGIVLSEQRHRSKVALRGNQIYRLTGGIDLILEAVQVFYSAVHAVNDN